VNKPVNGGYERDTGSFFHPVGRKSMSGFEIKKMAADDRWNSSTGYPPLFVFSEISIHEPMI
jgi:hypothetical protein